MLTFSLSYHKITLFENKYGIKLITLISMYHLKPLVSLQVQLKLKCRCTNCFLYWHFSDPFHNYFSKTNFIDGFWILKMDILKFIQQCLFSLCSLYTAKLNTLYFVIICSVEDLFTLNGNKFRMVYKVDGNPQLDSRDWSMYSNILNSLRIMKSQWYYWLQSFLAVATKQRSEMTWYLINGYDVMNYFAKLEKFVPHIIIMPSFSDCQKSNAKVRPGDFFAPPPPPPI